MEPTGKAVEAPEQADEAVENAEQPEPSDSGTILVSRQPVAVLASPSLLCTHHVWLSGWSALPRVIGHDGSFAHIQDLNRSKLIALAPGGLATLCHFRFGSKADVMETTTKSA